MQPLFRQVKRNAPFLVASVFATGVFAYILRKVFAVLLRSSLPARVVLSVLITLFFVSLTSFLLKSSRMSEEVARSLN
ncbi:MAG: hypothetical protein Q7S65_04915 [Nanoarchaeota archaeon]|nr:hypothetical protein [Nanoarchaeota archaeon]